MKKALIVASVASMIDQFNIPNIQLLIEMGYEVHVACNFVDSGTIPSERTKELMTRLDNMDVEYFQIDFDRNAFNIFRNLKAYKQLKKVLKNDYKLVHSHSPVGGAVARISASKYRKKGLKSIYTAHGFHFYKGAPLKMWLLFYPIEKALSRYTDIIITINKEDYERSTKKFHSKKNIYIPGIGIDTQKFSPVTRKIKAKLRKKFKLSPNDFVMVYVGELSYRKNQEMLIKVIEELKNDILTIKLFLVGTGPKFEEYENLIQNKELQNQVKLLGYRTDIKDLMSIADVAVSTSRQEGLPVNVMEAMSTGIPLVVTNCRGNADLMHGLQKEFVTELNDTQKFENLVKQLYESKKLREQLGENNRKIINNYSVENVLEYYKSIYK